MVYDWFKGRPTTKQYAIDTHRVTQAQWQQAVAWAVDNRLGEYMPSEGGAKKLRWTADSLNQFLPQMEQLALLA